MSIMSIDSTRYEITFGYDEGLQGFWLIIHYAYAKTEKNLNHEIDGDQYIFHNMINWPGIRMTINDVKGILSKYGERISTEDLDELYLEAQKCGYFSKLDINDFSYQTQKGEIKVSARGEEDRFFSIFQKLCNLKKDFVSRINNIDNTIAKRQLESIQCEPHAVNREELEKSLDFIISLEPNYSLGADPEDIEEKYKSDLEKYKNEIKMAHNTIQKYGKQIYPNTLENMQHEFYSILESEKYKMSQKSGALVSSLLSRNWHEIGEWQQ